ncbi:restriction endonuclease subunit S, partial [SAR116 cluster bacterium]|nr:restriction endonuclease subunit S [SAR116 cluster bacterium]
LSNYKIQSLFNEITSPMIQKISNSLDETKVLSELRDTLLPKLISGELKVPNAEKIVSEVI